MNSIFSTLSTPLKSAWPGSSAASASAASLAHLDGSDAAPEDDSIQFLSQPVVRRTPISVKRKGPAKASAKKGQGQKPDRTPARRSSADTPLKSPATRKSSRSSRGAHGGDATPDEQTANDVAASPAIALASQKNQQLDVDADMVIEEQPASDRELDTGKPLEDEDEHDDPEYKFKAFLDHRWNGNSIEIEVEWENGEKTWEPEALLHEDASDTLFEHWRQQGGRPLNPSDSDMFEVFAIRKHSKDRKRYLVEWVGYEPKEASWLTRKVLEETAQDVLDDYWDNQEKAGRA